MRTAASVLPDPVGADTSVSTPSATEGQASTCGGVGPAGKRRANQVATAGWRAGKAAARPLTGSPAVGGPGSRAVGSIVGSIVEVIRTRDRSAHGSYRWSAPSTPSAIV